MTVTEIQSRIGEIQSRLVTLAAPAVARTAGTSGAAFAQALASAQGGTATASPGAASSGGVTGGDVVAAAKKYLGVPYVFGGTDPAKGLDCSGLVQRVYKDLGIDLPRLVRHQRLEGEPVASLAQAKPGDLLVFDGYQHIGIYLGNGKMLHAPQPGENVKIGNVYEKPTSIRRIVSEGAPAVDAASLARPAMGGSLAGVPYGATFAAAAKEHGIPAALLAAVAKVESNYNPRAVSHAGAQGLMQFMPATARDFGVDPFDPASAIDGAARKLAGDLETFGSVPLALAAYNAGPGAVRKYDGIPPFAETQAYVPKVLAAMQRIERGGS